MYFDSMQAMLHMDGHGAFVWSAYAITAIVLVLILVVPRRRSRGALRRIAGEQRRAEAGEAMRGRC